MAKIIFLILPFFVLNFYEVYFSANSYLMDLKYFLRIDNEYFVIYLNDINKTYYGRVNATNFEVINEGKLFDKDMKYFLYLDKNSYIFILNNYLIREKNAKREIVKFGSEHHEFTIKFLVEVLY